MSKNLTEDRTVQASEGISSMPTDSAVYERIATLETKINIFLTINSVTIVAIVGMAFWLGTTLAELKTSGSQSTIRTDKVYEVVLTDKESLNARTKAIETKLDDLKDAIERKPLGRR